MKNVKILLIVLGLATGTVNALDRPGVSAFKAAGRRPAPTSLKLEPLARTPEEARELADLKKKHENGALPFMLAMGPLAQIIKVYETESLNEEHSLLARKYFAGLAQKLRLEEAKAIVRK